MVDHFIVVIAESMHEVLLAATCVCNGVSRLLPFQSIATHLQLDKF